MECNRDEALRAKSIAEEKLENKDFAGAKKFAVKAQTLYPGLDGISQILTTLDVYISAENKVSGEIDWYGVLGVNPSADDEAIKKQYRKLALLLHPDKNKSVGADNAFKLISEAWGLLSDKTKRLAYNQRRSSRSFQKKFPMHTGGPSAPSPRPNGIFNFANRNPKTQNSTTKQPVKPAKPTHPQPPSQRSDTFWTICHRCKMHYEYLKMYLNSTLLCPNCREAFKASETAPPANFSKKSNQVPRQRQQTSSVRHNPANDPGKNVPVAQNMGPSAAGINLSRYPQYQHRSSGGTGSSVAAKAANVVQKAHDKLKRPYSDQHTGSDQRRRLDDDSRKFGMNYNASQGNGGFGVASDNVPGSRFYDSSGPYTRHVTSNSELTMLETRNMLMKMARDEILMTLQSWSLETEDSGKGRHKRSANMQAKSDQKVNGGLSTKKVTGQQAKGLNTHFDDSLSKREPENESMNVPDSDFHEFDLDRAESSFGDNEVWSAYDDDDGMPRFYALVNKVISRNPLKLKIAWLNSKTTTEFGALDWMGSGFYKTCGEFRVGKYENFKKFRVNAFSQKIVWSKGPRGSILILPHKGDVWAMYKNWSSNWNEHTPDEIVHKYDMVTVVDDYKEEEGVRVAPLLKVAGFKTVFRPNFDPESVMKIPNGEMFRFSHHVPSHLLTGLESPNAPKGYLELDPAATPLELLQVITEDDKANAAEKVLHAEQGGHGVLKGI